MRGKIPKRRVGDHQIQTGKTLGKNKTSNFTHRQPSEEGHVVSMPAGGDFREPPSLTRHDRAAPTLALDPVPTSTCASGVQREDAE